MPNRSDDRYIREMSNKENAGYAKRFIGKMNEKLKRSGITSKERTSIYRKMKGIDKIKKKFESGEELSQKKYFK